MRASQAGTKLDRTQTAEELLRLVMRIFRVSRCMTSLLELVVFLAPPLRPDADRPCALRLAGALSTVEPM